MAKGILGLTGKGFTTHKAKRLLGFVIDALVVLCLCFIAYNFLGGPDYHGVKELMDQLNALQGTDAAQAKATEMFTAFNNAWGATLLVWFAYETACTIIIRGSTLGKLICGFMVVNNKDGKFDVKTAFRIALRSLVKAVFLYILQGLPFLIASLTIFANAEHRTGADFFSGTRVVDRPRKAKELMEGSDESNDQHAHEGPGDSQLADRA